MSFYRTYELYSLDEGPLKDFLSSYEYPWLCLGDIKAFVTSLTEKMKNDPEHMELEPGVVVHKSAKIAKSALISPPCYIGEGAEIRHCAFIRGSAYIGKGCTVGNSTEIKNAVLTERVEAPHFNYVGDSVLGKKSHLGAGAVTSNVKSDRTDVSIRIDSKEYPTGRYKVGAFLGDGAEIGCNTTLCPGTVIGKRTSVYPCSCVRGGIEPDSIYKSKDSIIRRKV